MAKYGDIRSAGPSALCPYRPYESPSARHRRRRISAISQRRDVEKVCSDNGIVLSVTNGGHHWKFSKGVKKVEWWPSSAKLVENGCWGQGVHVHDHEQAIALVLEYLNRPSPTRPTRPRSPTVHPMP